MHYGLALHTTTPELGLALDVAVSEPLSRDRRLQVWALGRSAASLLHGHLDNFLQPQTWQDLAFLAVARGPGGFTGTRLGMVTARTLAQQLDIPLFAVSTLAAVAQRTAAQRTAAQQQPEQAIAVEMRAQRGQVFAGIYSCGEGSQPPTPLLADRVVSPEEWQQIQADWPTPLPLATAEEDLAATVGEVLAIAQQHYAQGDRPHWSAALPFYGQHPVT